MTVPDSRSLPRLTEAADSCQMCELYKSATQTVFGEGRRSARLMLIGEQPGDTEDKQGHVFVGPAGHVLDRVLDEAGLSRGEIYLTNAVKHFRWKPADRGNRRLHQRPTTTHIRSCQPWLAAELRAVRPAVIVALGAVAAEALFGSKFSLTRSRGAAIPWPPTDGPFTSSTLAIGFVVTTIHPSAVLRGRDDDRAQLREGLVADLVVARKLLNKAGS